MEGPRKQRGRRTGGKKQRKNGHESREGVERGRGETSRGGEAMKAEKGSNEGGGETSGGGEAMKAERATNGRGKKTQRPKLSETRRGGGYLRQESAAGLTGSPHITDRRDPSWQEKRNSPSELICILLYREEALPVPRSEVMQGYLEGKI